MSTDYPLPDMHASKIDGNLVVDAMLSQEDKEHLKVLFYSAGWRIYRKMLIVMKEGHQLHMYPMKDPNEVLKELGIVVGLNSSINQLGVFMAQIKKHDERVAQESKNGLEPSRD